MKKANIQIAAILLALAMILIVLPVAAFATGGGPDIPAIEEPATPTNDGPTATPTEEKTTTTEKTDDLPKPGPLAAAGIGTFALTSGGTIDIGGETGLSLDDDHTNPSGAACSCGVTHDKPGWSWDKETATLTLDGYSSSMIAITCDPADTISLYLAGGATVNTGGIDCDGTLEISGSAKLTVSGGTAIRGDSGVSVLSGTVDAAASGTAIAGKIVSISGGTVEIAANYGISSPDVSISGGKLTASVGAFGIHSSGKVSVSGSADVTISDSKTGIAADDEISISGGTVDIEGYNYGLSTEGNIFINGGTGTIEGGELSVSAWGTLDDTGVTVLGSGDGGGTYTIASKIGEIMIPSDDLTEQPVETFVDASAEGEEYSDWLLRYIRFPPIPKSEPAPTAAPEPEPEPEQSYGPEPSSGDSVVPPRPPLDDGWLDLDEARPLAANSRRQNLDYARTFRATRYGVRGKSWAELEGLRFYHDSMLSGAVQVRVTFDDPSLFSEDVRVSGYVAGARVDTIRALFEKWFVNPVRAIHFDNPGDWENPVRVAAKLDLAGLDATKLVFYSYDPKTGVYRRLAAPAYWVDANGYLHFTTELAGEIVVSEGPLVKK